MSTKFWTLFGADSHDPDFYSYDETISLSDIFKKNNIENFHKFMEKFRNDELVQKYITKHKLEISLELFKKKFVKSIALHNIRFDHTSIIIMEILIAEYNFILDKEFMEYAKCFIDTSMLLLFNKYFDLTIYIKEIGYMFKNLCANENADDIKKFLIMGFDIDNLILVTNSNNYKETAWHGAIISYTPDILKYLLEYSQDFKKYELEMIIDCVRMKRHKHLELLLDYGINLELINNITVSPNRSIINIYKLLSSHGIDPEKLIALMDDL